MYEIFAGLLKAHGITPYRVHKDTGISQTTLSDWKTGKITPKVDKLQKIADYFGVSVAYLMTGEDIVQKETPATKKSDERSEEFPIITRIARNGKKMPPDQQEKLLKLAQAMFPEYFDDDTKI